MPSNILRQQNDSRNNIRNQFTYAPNFRIHKTKYLKYTNEEILKTL